MGFYPLIFNQESTKEDTARPIFLLICGLTAEKVVGLHPTPDQGGLLVLSKTSMLNSQLDIPISRSKRPLAFALGGSMTSPTELKAPWAISALMLSRQTLVPDSTDAISASMPRSRNERKCPAATPRGGELL